MVSTRRQLLAGAAAAGGLAIVPARAIAQGSAITPESFGARGDGLNNDSAAFARMAAFVNSRGGGQIVLRSTTYLVGRQAQIAGPGEHYAFEPALIMDFLGCRGPLVIRGRGARLRCAPGLRYGTFDPLTGRPTHHPARSLHAEELATPYRAMIRVEDCSGGVDISGLELDGNVRALQIGGEYGDIGWQVPAVGIHLVNNRGPERLSRIYVHHHALDGLMIDGAEHRTAASTILWLRSEHNGRQGCSIVGGHGYSFSDCSFSHTGKAGISSAPGAGIDIEAEGGKSVRGLSFTRCRFVDNAGAGVVADSGNSEDATFVGCTFVGTTNWAAWPNKPAFRFADCMFVGAIVHAFGDPDPRRAAQFHRCVFRDDPALSPTGEVYGGENPSRPIADLPGNPNVRFDECTFNLTHRAVLPWTTNVVIFADCTLTQRAPAQSYPRGTFVGRNVLSGNINLYSARIMGEVFLNGERVPPT